MNSLHRLPLQKKKDHTVTRSLNNCRKRQEKSTKTWSTCIQSELRYLEEAGLTWRRGPRKGAQGCGLDCDQLFATKWSQKQTIPNPSLISVIGRPIDRAEKLPTNVDFVWLCVAFWKFEKIGKVCRTHRWALIDRLTDWLKNKKLWSISISFCCSQTSEHKKITDYWLTVDRRKRSNRKWIDNPSKVDLFNFESINESTTQHLIVRTM